MRPLLQTSSHFSNNSFGDSAFKFPLFDEYYNRLLLSLIFIYLIFQIVIICNTIYTTNEVCNKKFELKSETYTFLIVISLVFFMNAVIHLIRILKVISCSTNKSRYIFHLSMSLLLISVIGGTSHLLLNVNHKFCQDSFG